MEGSVIIDTSLLPYLKSLKGFGLILLAEEILKLVSIDSVVVTSVHTTEDIK